MSNKHHIKTQQNNNKAISYKTGLDASYNDCFNMILSYISLDEIKDFIIDAYEAYPMEFEEDKKRRQNAINCTFYLIRFLMDKKLLNPLYKNKQADTAIAACLLHNLFFDISDKRAVAENWLPIFDARIKLGSIAQKHTTQNSVGAFEYIFQIIEAQCGEAFPIAGCRPVYGQVTYIVWEVIYFFYHQFKGIAKEAEMA